MHLQCLLGGQPLESFRKKEERSKKWIKAVCFIWFWKEIAVTIELHWVHYLAICVHIYYSPVLDINEIVNSHRKTGNRHCATQFIVSSLFVSQRKNININTDLRTIGYKNWHIVFVLYHHNALPQVRVSRLWNTDASNSPQQLNVSWTLGSLAIGRTLTTIPFLPCHNC